MAELAEFALIHALQRRLQSAPADPDTLLGIGDDAALLRGHGVLAVALDTLNEGVHFFPGTDPADIGWKALAVNLSDLAAMGAQPRWALLSLSLPQIEPGFVEAFMAGWQSLATSHGVQLIGGDTTRGPCSISVTLLGQSAPQPLLRSAAQAGDDLYLSGCCGEAAVGLALRRGDLALADANARTHLLRRLDRPQPRVALGQALAGAARAAIDVSDGLLADLQHLLTASGGLGAELALESLPETSELHLAAPSLAQRRQWQLAGGDDYELLFTAAPADREAIAAAAATAETPITRIGRLTPDSGIRLLQNGIVQEPPATGWRHF